VASFYAARHERAAITVVTTAVGRASDFVLHDLSGTGGNPREDH
jgi:hypothetical protein